MTNVHIINQRAHINGKLWFLPNNTPKYESRNYKTLLLTFVVTRPLNPSFLSSPLFMTVIKQDILSGLYATVYFKMVVKTSVSSQTRFTARLADISSLLLNFSTRFILAHTRLKCPHRIDHIWYNQYLFYAWTFLQYFSPKEVYSQEDRNDKRSGPQGSSYISHV